MVNKLRLLNVGCGNKFDKSWENVDMVSNSKYVKEYNLIKGFPYPDQTFEAVYHSHVLEHIPKENAPFFIDECYRVLDKGGILRIVLPDLENIAREYIRLLDENLHESNEVSRANYDWIMLELYDQTIRNKSGGMMKSYLESDVLVNNSYLNQRIGYVGEQIIQQKNQKQSKFELIKQKSNDIGYIKLTIKLLQILIQKLKNLLFGKKYCIGDFRTGGEIHYWMYDRFSLKRLLLEAGFKDVKVMDPHNSQIKNWKAYQLDVKNDMIFDPTSLFIEATK